METVSIKLEDEFARDMEAIMRRHRYTTKTEFIREAIRDKLKRLEREEALRAIDRLAGSSKRKTTDEDIHRARARAGKEFERELGIK